MTLIGASRYRLAAFGLSHLLGHAANSSLTAVMRPGQPAGKRENVYGVRSTEPWVSRWALQHNLRGLV